MADKSERALREEKILNFWKEKKIFEKTLEKPAPKGEAVFYDGPPFATGLPHYGHILPGTIKDVIPRYKTMQGYRVPRRWGWDCHGLPIENLVEKELGLETKKDIEKFGVAKFNERARESVLRYEEEWKEIIPRTGRWIDMENSYKTMDSSFTESVWWSFKTLFDKGLVYQGFKSMHLCPRCETTLSNFEVNQGYKDIIDISVYVKLELLEEPGTYFIAWTTTPWTLPGNVALAVNPGISYVEVETEQGKLILAEERLSALKDLHYKKLRTFSGQDLVGKKYKTLFDYYLKESQVYGAEFVKAEEGTGIVHIAPAFGEEDYELSQKEKLPFVQHVGTDGRFKPEVVDFAGQQVKPKDNHQSTDIEIIKYLAAKNSLFAKEKIIHSYPHCWRCDTPLLNYASSSWFVKVTALKDKLLKNNATVKWVPEEVGVGRFGKWLEGARDWAVSRSRFWGAPLPVWQNADRSKTLVVDSVETLRQSAKKLRNEYIALRHGEAENNTKKIVDCGKNNFHLTENGREQVQKALNELRGQNIDVIISSDVLRTQETAGIVSTALGKEVILDPRIREFNFGSFEGRLDDEWREFAADYYNFWQHGPEGGESLKEMRSRLWQFISKCEERYDGKSILLVTHEYDVWLLKALAEDWTEEELIKAKIESGKDFVERGSVTSLEFKSLPRNDKGELDLHRPYIDDVVLEVDGEEYRRVPEVFDTWYDSGSVPFASRGARDFRPADFIAEGLDQTRGWFYTMSVLGTALFGKFPFKQVTVNGLVLAEDGKKMSKRLKNYPELTDVLDRYGADALRYYLLASGAVRADDLAFSEKGLDEVVKKNLNRLENVLSFYELYSNESNRDSSKLKTVHVLDEWVDLKLEKLINEVTEALEAYELDRAVRPIGDFIEDLSTWYLRRSRTRPEALPKLQSVLITLAKVIAPLMPFMAEDMYRRLQGEKESVHLESWPEVKRSFFSSIFGSKDNLLEEMGETRRIVSLALELRQKADVKVRQPLQKLSLKRSELPEKYLEIIKDELNVKEVIVNSSLEEEMLLDTQLTQELLEEGRMREVVRTVQEWRKERKLKPGEVVHYEVPAGEEGIFSKFREEIKRTTNIEF